MDDKTRKRGTKKKDKKADIAHLLSTHCSPPHCFSLSHKIYLLIFAMTLVTPVIYFTAPKLADLPFLFAASSIPACIHAKAYVWNCSATQLSF